MTPHTDLLFERMRSRTAHPAVIEREHEATYGELLGRIEAWCERLGEHGLGAGSIVAYVGDYGVETIALTLALVRAGAIAMPVSAAARGDLSEFMQIAGCDGLVEWTPEPVVMRAEHAAAPLIERFRPSGHGGFVVFSSGSTGRPKGILHDAERVLVKFAKERHGSRMLMMLMLDHFGGLNSLLAALSYGGVAVCVAERTPEAVATMIERAHAEILPTTPTFLNMLLLSDAWKRHDLSSLTTITYGAEPMPESTLRRVRAAFPNVRAKQTYGLSEVGVLHSASPDEDSLWLRVGGDGFETKVVDGVLHIRSASNMVGYLNAPDAFDADGWMNTKDLVEEKDGMIRFLGRVTEIINVGGQKVFPAEVESVLITAPNVADATVYGKRHPVLGQAVCARITLGADEPQDAMAARLRDYCSERLAKFKVPMRYEIVSAEDQNTIRGKKRRTGFEEQKS